MLVLQHEKVFCKSMKIKYLIVLLLASSFAFAQGEANIWYFGKNAGLDFNSGSPVALTDGQINTQEGCAVLSNAAGQLLFYTDGVTVYNRNHQIMVNGSGLMGHSSAAQSGTIIPMPGSNNLFYVFTVDYQTHPNGLRYSIIDLTMDNGLGAITAVKNIPVLTPTTENVAVTKHGNGMDYWIITHGIGNNSFYAYQLTPSGLLPTPIVTNIGAPLLGSGFDGAGYMKVAPSGTKLAFTSVTDFLKLYDFNNSTGVISNELTILTEPGELYGIEFSPNEQVLYVTNSLFGKLYQYNLSAANIPSSQVTLFSGLSPGALQIGPDGKIYLAIYDQLKLGVINNPDIVGVGCNYQTLGVDLGGKMSRGGLPAFNQSFFFTPAIQLDNACVGQSTSFQFTTNQTVTSATWNFGDGNTSNSINPTHTYTTSGSYNVSVTITTPQGTGVNSRTILISDVPTATVPQNLKICDDNNDGFYNFDLTQQSISILNGQSTAQYQIRYFASTLDYTNNIPIATPATYQNSTAYQPQTIIAEVSNNANSDCKVTATFTIQVYKSVLPATNIPPIKLCDNTSVGTDSDGKVVFDLTQNQTAILNGQSLLEFTIAYYKDSTLTQLIVSPATYQNANASETIYVKVSNSSNADCFAVTSFEIEVYALPVVNNVVSLKQCDDDLDGFSSFNLLEAKSLLVSNPAGFTFSFFETALEAQNNTGAITNSTNYTNMVVSNDVVFVRIQNANNCFRVAQLNLIVSTTLIPSSFQKIFTECDDNVSGSNTDGIATFDFSSVTAQIQALYPAGQLLDITYYKNQADALSELNPIANPSNYSNIGYPNSQNIYVRVDSQLNNECLGLGHHITLHVEQIPIVLPQILRECDDDQDDILAFNTANLETNLLNGLSNVTVTYTDQNNSILPSPLPNPFVTSSQNISVTVTNNTAKACSYTSTIQFVIDDLPEAFAIPVNLTSLCDDESDPDLQNGIVTFDTSTFQNTILGSQSGMTVNYFDAQNNSLPSPLPNPFVSGTQNIRVEVINPNNNNCKTTYVIPLKVNELPRIDMAGNELICSNNPNFTKVIDAGLINPSTSGNYTYEWYFNNVLISNAMQYTLIVNTAGTYKVVVTNSYGCSSTRTIVVTASNVATIDTIQVNDLQNENSIAVLVSGLGNYVYSLDNINFQASNIFTGILPGLYTVYVRDLNECGIASEQISVLGIPKYFTPNNDGTNDYWNIKGISQNFNAKSVISVYDRYGKLLYQFQPLSSGWNGIYNGKLMPSDDYWYSVELQDGRTAKGHFSLKR